MNKKNYTSIIRVIIFQICILLILMALVPVRQAQSATLVVSSLADSGPNTLRQAVADASPGDTITFVSWYNQFIMLNSKIVIDKDLTIDGSGAVRLIIKGMHIFEITSGSVTINNLVLAGSTDYQSCATAPLYPTACQGAVVVAAGATVSVNNSTLKENISTRQYGGAAIQNNGTLFINNSTLRNNITGDGGGGLSNLGTATISNSTINNNETDLEGGGIHNRGTITIINTTVTGNKTGAGAGIYNSGTATIQHSTFNNNETTFPSGGEIQNSGTMTVANSIVAKDTGTNCVNTGTWTIGADSLDGDGSCGDATQSSALNLLSLADNGCATPSATPTGSGCVQTLALQSNSAAINFGGSCLDAPTLGKDQRGFSRDANCDAGAYEYVSSIICGTGPWQIAVHNITDLHAAIQCFNLQTLPGTYEIHFSDDISTGFPTPLNIKNVHPNVELLIRGNNKILDVNRLNRGLRLFAGSVLTVEYLTIQNGLARSNGYPEDYTEGGGIWSRGTLTVRNSRFINNEAGFGGAIYHYGDGPLTVESSTFISNRAIGNNGGSITSLDEGGAIRSSGDGVLTIRQNTFVGNSADNNGGAVYSRNVETRIEQNGFRNNQAMNGGAIASVGYYWADATEFKMSIIGNRLDGNRSTIGSGGGIYLSNGFEIELIDNTLINNEAWHGGGIYYTPRHSTTVMTMQNNLFLQNQAVVSGGGLSGHGIVSLVDGTFDGNTASSGGAIMSSGNLTIDNAVLIRNTATFTNGGGILNTGYLTVSRTAILSNTSANGAGGIHSTGFATVSQSELRANHGTLGGALFADGNVALTELVFAENVAQNGGGIYLQSGTLDLSRSLFHANSASGNGAAIYNLGGATVANTTLHENVAVGDGGGVYQVGGASMTLNNVTVNANRANSVGGGLRADGGSLTVRNTLVANNVSDDCSVSSTTFSGSENNLASDGSCAGFTFANTDPLLGPLGAHPTLLVVGSNRYWQTDRPIFTLPLLAGSSAIDNGNASSCEAADQRGWPRQATCDIGAFEATSPANTVYMPMLFSNRPPADVSIVVRVNVPSVKLGGALQYALDVTNHSSVSVDNIEVTSQLPPELTLERIWFTEEGLEQRNRGQMYDFRLASLAANESVTIRVRGTVSDTLGYQKQIRHLATVSASNEIASDNNRNANTTWLMPATAEDPNNLTNVSFSPEYWLGLHSLGNSSVAWADYDNDGDSDLLLMGEYVSGVTHVTKLFQNDGNGGLVEQAVPFVGLASGAAAWGDSNGDGHLDLLIMGRQVDNTRLTKLYFGDGAGGFTEYSANTLRGLAYGDAAWADYDADGDLDFVLLGGDGVNRHTVIYTNDGSGTFTEDTAANLPGLAFGETVWADSDWDGDLDLLLTGDDPHGTSHTLLYTNDGSGGMTENQSISLPGIAHGAATWGDYDEDGDLDLLLSGEDNSGQPLTRLYKNSGGAFTHETAFAPVQVSQSTASWADYDGNGSLDLLVIGFAGSQGLITAYANNGSGQFSQQDIYSFSHQTFSGSAWADYDNDGDIDFIFTGQGSTVFRNTRY